MSLKEAIEILETIRTKVGDDEQDAIDKVIARARTLNRTPDLRTLREAADGYARKDPANETVRREAYLAGAMDQMERGIRIHDVVKEVAGVIGFRDTSFVLSEMDEEEICEKLQLEEDDRVIIQVYPK